MSQEQINRYNKQKGKIRANKLIPENPIDALIDNRQRAKKLAEEKQTKETIDKQVKEEIEKQIKDIFK